MNAWVRCGLSLFLVFLLTQCSVVRKTERLVGLGGSGPYVKKIGMLGIANRTYFPTKEMNGYADSLGDTLTQLVNEDQMIAVTPIEALVGEQSRFGKNLDNRAIMELGRKYGLNAFVRGSISELTYRVQKFGIYGFRKQIPTIELRIQVELVDVETGTILMQEKRVPVEKIPDEYASLGQYLNKNAVPPPKLMEKSIKDLAGDARDVLAEQPWKSFVVETNGDKIVLSSGTDVGLAQGVVLDVRNMGRPMVNYLGQAFLIPGERVGQVSISECREHYCVATLSDQVVVQAGDALVVPD